MTTGLNRRRVLAAALAVPTAATLLASSPAPARPASSHPLRVKLPRPGGPHKVGTTTLHLIDHSRHDPYVTTQPYRELMVNITYPARDTAGHQVAGWLTPGWAANTDEVMQNMIPGRSQSLVDWADTRAHAYVDAPVDRAGGLPVLLYSLGHWASHSLNRAAIEDLASRGYVVIAFDPTFETPVEFPGARMVPTNEAAAPPPDILQTSVSFLEYIRNVYAARVTDARFVLDQLATLNTGRNPDAGKRSLPHGLYGALDLDRIGAFSGGIASGVISLQLMHEDHRIAAAVTGDIHLSWQLDTGPVPILPVVQRGLDRPVLAINPTSAYAARNPFWDQMWNGLRGRRLELELLGGGEVWLSDAQSILPQVRRGLKLPQDTYVPLIGTVDPAESVAAQRAYLAAFFDRNLRHRDGHLLDGPSPRHRVIRFVR
jgi:hypothetical protein